MVRAAENSAIAHYEEMGSRLDRADFVRSSWPAPDMTLVDNGRRPAVPMPPALFGPAWPIIEEVADNTATAPDYAAMGYLAAAASLVGGKRWASPYGDWQVPCILWCGLLGDPSSRKSAPLKAMTKPLWKIEDDASELHAEAMREWAADAERAKAELAAWQGEIKKVAGSGEPTPERPVLADEPDKPCERTVIVSDITPEAAASVLADNPQGVLCFNDELAGWLESFERYTTGGRPFWLSAFEGSPHKVNRKGSAPLRIKFTGISVLGSIQPDVVAPLLAGANDGLVPRILWAWPESQPPRIPENRVNLDALENAYRRLESLPWATGEDGSRKPVIMSLSDDARRTFHAWEVDNAASVQGGGGLYAGFVGKLSGAVARLALVSELTRWAFQGGREPVEVSNAAIAAAIDWAESYGKPMAQRVYGDASVSVADRNASLLARYIKAQGFERINLRELRQHPHRGELKALQAKGALDDAVEVLEASGWVRAAFHRDGDTPGQPRKDYEVNPAIGRGQ